MAERQDFYVDIAQVRIGLFIYLDTGWMDHPFSLSSFKIRSQDQIDTLRSLGLKRIRYCPDKTDQQVLQELAAELAAIAAAGAVPVTAEAPAATPKAPDPLQQRRQLLSQQRASLQRCERQFGEASRLEPSDPQPLIMVGSLVLRAVLGAAVYRAVLTPEDDAWGYLRLGMRELWVGATSIVIGIIVGFGIVVPILGIYAKRFGAHKASGALKGFVDFDQSAIR